MKIALIGYGKMGKEIEKIAVERKHEIVARIDKHNFQELNSLKADIAIEFTQPDSAPVNYKKMFDQNIPVVSGTTGIASEFDNIVKYCNEKKASFFYATNFSVGVNIFFSINKLLAKLTENYNYKCNISETHHIHKMDAPSGTAISIADDIISQNRNFIKWELKNSVSDNVLPIESFREGEVTGTHSVKWQSEIDEIEIKHKAYTRKGFAFGAVLAAEFLIGKTGVYGMKDLLKL
ncbi:MAG TPA: 4-hydroxy-tetrahydrodipicolinate reductase [Bacteroidales bacterium]|jgi:4-hydroxy-tetrahydrodipicolinate reductase|nr:4-hydroxy-tetrahydrodipicolinate reductase [Bacteroidales bacterium]HRW22243.1 4-hydroxy-tetrahydrodipicolinate reductase [Bacteroidales bacterium]